MVHSLKPKEEWIQFVAEELWRQLSEANLKNREAGIALVFGTAPRATSSAGKENAKKFVEFVLPRISVFRDSATRFFWGGSPNSAKYYGSATGEEIEGEVDNGFTIDFYLMTEDGMVPQSASKNPDCG